MKRSALALVLLLSACASQDQAPSPATPSPATASPGLPPPAVAAAPKLPLPPPDQCGAYELQDLVGKPRQSIPVPVDPSRRRVACTTCPVTEDLRPDRLTILYDAQTGLVTKVQCQ